VSFQTTEYATKVALLTGLVLVCATRPLIERFAPVGHDESLLRWARSDPRRGVGITMATVAAIALVGTGAWWSASDASGGALEQGSSEPTGVELRDDQRPAIELGAGLESLGTPVDSDTASGLVNEVVEGVLLADRAVEGSDPELAATVATGPFLAELTEQPAEPAIDRTFDTALLDVVRDLDDFQAVPRLSVAFTGTADGEAWSTTYHVSVTGDGSFIEREVPAG